MNEIPKDTWKESNLRYWIGVLVAKYLPQATTADEVRWLRRFPHMDKKLEQATFKRWLEVAVTFEDYCSLCRCAPDDSPVRAIALKRLEPLALKVAFEATDEIWLGELYDHLPDDCLAYDLVRTKVLAVN